MHEEIVQRSGNCRLKKCIDFVKNREAKIRNCYSELIQMDTDAPVASTAPTSPTAPSVASAPISSTAPASTKAQASNRPTKGDERKKKMVTTIPGGPMEPSLLKSFDSHVAYLIWTNPEVQKAWILDHFNVGRHVYNIKYDEEFPRVCKWLSQVTTGDAEAAHVAIREQLDHLGLTDKLEIGKATQLLNKLLATDEVQRSKKVHKPVKEARDLLQKLIEPTRPRNKGRKVIEEVESSDEEDNESGEKEKDNTEDEDGESSEKENDNEEDNESGEKEKDSGGDEEEVNERLQMPNKTLRQYVKKKKN
ncbi:hypothetical protein LguiB_027666 [Lonicera macranthoides]